LVDVTLVGNAYAPRDAAGARTACQRLPTRLVVHTLDKKVIVEAQEGEIHTPSLGYEHADGSEAVMGKGAGNGVRSHRLVAAGGGAAGYGPLASHWPERKRLLGSAPDPQPFQPGQPSELTADIDLKFFNAAPPEQQLPELSPG